MSKWPFPEIVIPSAVPAHTESAVHRVHQIRRTIDLQLVCRSIKTNPDVSRVPADEQAAPGRV